MKDSYTLDERRMIDLIVKSLYKCASRDWYGWACDMENHCPLGKHVSVEPPLSPCEFFIKEVLHVEVTP